MAIASLSRFTVPLSTNQSSASQGLLMPKLTYRFRVTLDNFGVAGAATTELTKQVISVGRPVVKFEQIKLSVYNSTVKLAGKHSFEAIKLSIRDDVTNTVSKKIGEQMQKQFDFYEQSSAASGIDYKFTTRVELLDGGNGAYTPGVLEIFELNGCYIDSATYREASYSAASDAMTVDLSISFDNALQVDSAGNRTGLGVSVGRTVRSLALG
jgi:hypothetical protein